VQLQLLAVAAEPKHGHGSALPPGQSIRFTRQGPAAHPLQGVAAGRPGNGRSQPGMVTVRRTTSGRTVSAEDRQQQQQQQQGGAGSMNDPHVLAPVLTSCPASPRPRQPGPLPVFHQQRRSEDAGRSHAAAGQDSLHGASHAPAPTSKTSTNDSMPPGRLSAGSSSGGWSFLQAPEGQSLLQPAPNRSLGGATTAGQQHSVGDVVHPPPRRVSSSLLKLMHASTEAGTTSSHAPTSQEDTIQQLSAAGAAYLRDGMPASAAPPRVVFPSAGRPLSNPPTGSISSGAQAQQPSNPLIFDLGALDLTDPAVLARLETAGSAGLSSGSHVARGRAAAAAAQSPGSAAHPVAVTWSVTDEGWGFGPPTALSLMQAGGPGVGQHAPQSQLQVLQLQHQRSAGRVVLVRAPSSGRASRSSLPSSSGYSRTSSLHQRLRSLSGAQMQLGARGPSTAPVPSRQRSQRSLPSSDGGATHGYSTALPSRLSRASSGGGGLVGGCNHGPLWSCPCVPAHAVLPMCTCSCAA
jgi:hypothetical protein